MIQVSSTDAIVTVRAVEGMVRLSLASDEASVEVVASFTPNVARGLMGAIATEFVNAGRQEVDSRDRAQHDR